MSNVDLRAPVIAECPAGRERTVIQFRPDRKKIIAHTVEERDRDLKSEVLCDPHKTFDAVPVKRQSSSKLSLEWLIKKQFPFVSEGTWFYFSPPPGSASSSKVPEPSKDNIVRYIAGTTLTEICDPVTDDSMSLRKRERSTPIPSNGSSKRPRNNAAARTFESNTSESNRDFKTLFKDELYRLNQNRHEQDFIRVNTVLKKFEDTLIQIKEEAERLKLPSHSCFICFDFEEKDVINWVGELLIQDLELSGIEVFSSRKLTYGASIPYFQRRIYDADKVILVSTKGGHDKIRKRIEEENSWRGIAAEMLMLLNSLENGRRGDTVIPIYEIRKQRKDTCLFPLFLGNKAIKDFVGHEINSRALELQREKALEASYPDIKFKTVKLGDLTMGTSIYYSEAVKLYGMIRGLDESTISQIQRNFISEAEGLLIKDDTNFSKEEKKAIKEWSSEKKVRSQEQLMKLRYGIEHPELQLAKHLKSFYLNRSIAREEGGLQWGGEYIVEGVDVDLIEIKEENSLDKASDHLGKGIGLELIFGDSNLDKSKKLILDFAGTGKSTLCHKAVLPESFLWKKFNLIFLVKLKNLVRYDLENDIYKILANEADFDVIDYGDLLVDPEVRKNSLLILDGYDELAPKADRLFKKFEQEFPHLLITSRPGFYKAQNLSSYNILGFNNESVESYVKKFFYCQQKLRGETPSGSSSLQDDFDEGKVDRILNFFRDKPELNKLARIPINLNLICHLFEELQSHFIPGKSITSTTLYIEVIHLLLKRCLVRLSEQKKRGGVYRLFKNCRIHVIIKKSFLL